MSKKETLLKQLYSRCPSLEKLNTEQESFNINDFPVYSNQWKAAIEIMQYFINNQRYVLLTAQPQSGKTGVCQTVSYLMDLLGIKKIYFICGMNDNNLKAQQIEQFNGLIPAENILFSKDLQYFSIKHRKSKLQYFRDSLIILDESHYAQSGIEQENIHRSMVHRFVTNHVGLTMDGQQEKWGGDNLYFLSVSATAMSEMVNLLNHENQKARVILRPAQTYYGFQKMVKNKKVHESFNLAKENQRTKLINILRSHQRHQQNLNQYQYAIIRFSNTGQGQKYRQEFKNAIDWDVNYICFHSKHMKLENINNLISKAPRKMTIIEVYHSLRAGIQLNTEHIFLVHDSPRALTDVTAQGLAGRCCGYFKEKHNVEIFCYQNRLLKYVNWIDHDFDPNYVPNNSNNIKQGYIEPGRDRFEARIPMGGLMPEELLEQLLEYKAENKRRYPKFEEIFGSHFRNLEFIDKKIWDQTDLVGVTILNEDNRTQSKTNTWIKFWDPAFKAYENQKRGSYFRNGQLPEEQDDFKYLYINLKREHPQFGYCLLTSQTRVSNDPKEYLRTTGQEEYHPENNPTILSLLQHKIKLVKPLTYSLPEPIIPLESEIVENKIDLQNKEMSVKYGRNLAEQT